MEYNPIQTMLNEHEIICQVEEIIKSLNKSWEIKSVKYVEDVSILLTFFKEYADGIHHRKEEEVLFPAICDHPDFIVTEIIDELEQHHDDFREYTIKIEEAFKNKEYKKSYHELKKYLQYLLDHIAIENNELFVLAESLLNEEELETIYFKFKDIDLEMEEFRKIELEESIINFSI